MFLTFLLWYVWWPGVAQLPSPIGGSERPLAAACEVGEPDRGRDPSHLLLTLQWELEDVVADKQVVWGRELFRCTKGPAGFHEGKTLP